MNDAGLAPLQEVRDLLQIPPRRRYASAPQPQSLPRPTPLQLVPLPTYAPWLNPIEKLWRWLRQEVLHLHRLSDAWSALQQQVRAFLDRFAKGSHDLLRYVGLLPN